MKRPLRFAGWQLVGWCALLLAITAGGILVTCGVGAVGWRTVIRASAQCSALLFLSAFSASALAQLWPNPRTCWLLRNRRYLGVSFAVSHTLHLFAILALARVMGDQFRFDPVTVLFGGAAYLFIAAMTATSFDRTAAWLGPRAWKRLHRTGAYYIWSIFVLQYAILITHSPWYAPVGVLVCAAMGVRIVAWMSARRSAFRPAGRCAS